MEHCPSCSAPLPATPNFPSWCTGCDWGLPEAEAEPRGGFLRKRLDLWSERMVRSLHEEISTSETNRPGWDAARVLSYAVALLVHAGTAALAVLAVWLVVAVPNVITVPLAVVAALLAFLLRPRFGSLREAPRVLRPDDAPALFGLLDRIADELDARRVHAVVPTPDFNAAYGTVGLRRRPVLFLGLPLWEALPEREKTAVLAHELAHGVNGDSRHGLVVGTSLATLARLYEALVPTPARSATLIDMIANGLARALQAVLRGLVLVVLVAQDRLTLRAAQRAEYLADALAARLASPAAVADALDTLVVCDGTHLLTAQQHTLNKRRSDYWDDLRAAYAELPATERERRRRVGARMRMRVDETHPPTHLRIAVLRGRADAEPALVMTADEEKLVRDELADGYRDAARELRDHVVARIS